MSKHLWPQLRLKANTEEELKEKYRTVYIEKYVRKNNGQKIEIYDWQGNRIIFGPHFFEHAFSESSDYRRKKEHNIPFSKKRARRILWIEEVLSATKGTIERRHQRRKDSRGRLKIRRTLIVLEEKYVVVLEQRKKPCILSFVTAFPADSDYIEKIRRESELHEIKKPQS